MGDRPYPAPNPNYANHPEYGNFDQNFPYNRGNQAINPYNANNQDGYNVNPYQNNRHDPVIIRPNWYDSNDMLLMQLLLLIFKSTFLT